MYTKGEMEKQIIDIICCESYNYGPEDMTRDIMEIPIIKSAPDLYEACKELVKYWFTPKYDAARLELVDVIKRAQKAISKAEGGK